MRSKNDVIGSAGRAVLCAAAVAHAGCGTPGGGDTTAESTSTSGTQAAAGSTGGMCFDGLPTPGTLCVPAWAEYTEADGLVMDLAAGDLDGDGARDLLTVVAGYQSTFQGLRWYRNNGFGGLEEPVSIPFDGADVLSGFFVVLADADADGDLDVFADGVGGIRWYENDGVGNLVAGSTIFAGDDQLCADAVVGDFDGDGRDDVASTCVTPADTLDLRIVWGGAGAFVPGDPLGILAVGDQLPGHGMAVADVDGDGHDDVLVSDDAAGEVYVVRGASDRTLVVGATVNVGPQRGGIAAADFDGDGLGDFVVVDPSTGRYATYLGAPDAVPVAGPSGEIVAPTNEWQGPGDPTPEPILGDWDADGRVDLMAGHLDAFPHVVLDLMEPERWPRAMVPAPYAVWGVTVDLDGDGVDDAVLVDRSRPATLYVGIVEP